MTESTRVIVFAKAPLPGLAKTRLVPALGETGAAALAARLLQRTLDAALQADLGPVELCATPAPGSEAWGGVSLPPSLIVSDQGPGDLGQRMARAARRALVESPRVLLVGTDCVEMSADLLRRAARALEGVEVALYPAVDGGYALLGLTRTDERLFRDIPWGGPQVARITLARIAALGWRLYQGEPLRDIDRPEDLRWLEIGVAGPGPDNPAEYGSKGRT